MSPIDLLHTTVCASGGPRSRGHYWVTVRGTEKQVFFYFLRVSNSSIISIARLTRGQVIGVVNVLRFSVRLLAYSLGFWFQSRIDIFIQQRRRYWSMYERLELRSNVNRVIAINSSLSYVTLSLHGVVLSHAYIDLCHYRPSTVRANYLYLQWHNTSKDGLKTSFTWIIPRNVYYLSARIPIFTVSTSNWNTNKPQLVVQLMRSSYACRVWETLIVF